MENQQKEFIMKLLISYKNILSNLCNPIGNYFELS